MELQFELDEHAAHVDGDSVGSLDEAVLEALLAKKGRIEAKIDSLEAQARSTRYIQEYTKYYMRADACTSGDTRFGGLVGIGSEPHAQPQSQGSSKSAAREMEKLRWSVGPDRSRRQAACRAAAQDRSRVQALRYERNREESRLKEAIEDAAKYRAQMLPTELGDANALIVEEKEKLAAMRSVLQRTIPSSTSGRLAEYGRCDVDSCVLHKRTLESKAIHSDDGLMVESIGSRTHDPLSPDSNLVLVYLAPIRREREELYTTVQEMAQAHGHSSAELASLRGEIRNEAELLDREIEAATQLRLLLDQAHSRLEHFESLLLSSEEGQLLDEPIRYKALCPFFNTDVTSQLFLCIPMHITDIISSPRALPWATSAELSARAKQQPGRRSSYVESRFGEAAEKGSAC